VCRDGIVNPHCRCRPGLGLRRTARPGLVAGGGLVRLLGAVAGVESVMAADALDRDRGVGGIAAFAADPESGADLRRHICR
jgi:hypothetical protein